MGVYSPSAVECAELMIGTKCVTDSFHLANIPSNRDRLSEPAKLDEAGVREKSATKKPCGGGTLPKACRMSRHLCTSASVNYSTRASLSRFERRSSSGITGTGWPS